MELEKIGENAGKVWHVLNEGRELTIPELSRRIDLSHEDTTLAIGWLARENKIYIQRKNGQNTTRTILWIIYHQKRQ